MITADACSECVHGLKFADRRRTYWCKARLEKISLTSCNCAWGRVCSHYKARDTWEIRAHSPALSSIFGLNRAHPLRPLKAG